MNNKIIFGLAGLGTFVAGGAVGYFVAQKRVEARFEVELSEEITKTKDFYRTLYKKDEFETPQSAVEALIPKDEQEPLLKEAVSALDSYQGDETFVQDGGRPNLEADSDGRIRYNKVESNVKVESAATVRNIFTNPPDISDEEDEEDESGIRDDEEIILEKRDPEKPYILTEEEFLQAETDYRQVSITYFEHDDLLVDERENPIDDVEAVVGVENLNHFGVGSTDKNVLYVRNDRIELDFEVTRTKRSYAEEVFGIIEHSDTPRNRKFRGGYE